MPACLESTVSVPSDALEPEPAMLVPAGEPAAEEPAAEPKVTRLNITGGRNWYFALSLLIIIPGILSMGLLHFRLGIDFAGGTEFTINFANHPSVATVESAVQALNVGGTVIQASGGDFIIRTVALTPQQQQGVEDKLTTVLGPGANPPKQVLEVGGTIAGETITRALLAVVIAAAAILLLLVWRFRKVPGGWRAGLQFGGSALAALLHDVFVLTGIFSARAIEHVGIRQELDPLFPGINPEPIEPHIQALRDAVLREKCHAGFATDGDADRIGAIAEDGSFVDAHKCFAVILQWLLERRPQWTGDVVRAFNTTSMLDRIAARYGRKLHECGIGFKYICDLMLAGDILVGGEESGGIGITRHLPERDGILNSLLLANIMAEEGKTLAQLVARLQKEYGPHYFGRRDLHIPDDLKQSAIQRASANATLSRVGSYRVVRRQDLDGIKVFLDAPRKGNGAEAWVLLRASGTEPLLRLYSEASSPALVDEILAAAEDFVRDKATAA